MIDIVCFDDSITINKIITYDELGQPQLEVQLSVNLITIDERIIQLEKITSDFMVQQTNENLLRQQYPALQDQYEKYQMMLGIVKEATE